MYCPVCGTENEREAAACEVCGARLEVKAGSRSCHACGARVGDRDRHCHQCGAALEQKATSRYEPGPSFLDDDDLQVDPAELPAWLRDLAAAPQPAPARTVEADEAAMPDWLKAVRPGAEPSVEDAAPEPPPPAPAPAGPAPTSTPADDLLSLISEDDLPEWLRTLGAEEHAVPPAAEARPAEPSAASTGASASFLAETPAVSRAWLARPRAADAAAEEEFAPLDEPEPRPAESIDALQAAPPAPAADAAPASQRGRPLLRLALVALVVLVALLVAFMVLGGR